MMKARTAGPARVTGEMLATPACARHPASARGDQPCRGHGAPTLPRIRAFTLIELLVVVAVISVLAGLLFPALAQAKQRAHGARCVNQLRQLGFATQMYWEDHDDTAFKYLAGFTNGGAQYWFGWLGAGSEGERAFDATVGALYPYLQGRGIELCPALEYTRDFKLKANGAAYGYGYNRHLSGVRLARVRNPGDTVLLADAAQVNDFQAPASADHPLLEEFYYVSTNTFEATAHFRHQHQANAVFGDGHVGREAPMAGSLDARMPQAWVGRLDPERLWVP